MIDWNLEAEINSFIHRINICDNQTQFDRVSALINHQLNPTVEATENTKENKSENSEQFQKSNIEKCLSFSLDSILDAPSIVKSQFLEDLLDHRFTFNLNLFLIYLF